MSSQEHEIPDPEARIAEALEEKREKLEQLAESDTAFSRRAEAALDWLEDYEEENDA